MPLAKNRPCKACGLPGLVKSRSYHQECKPRRWTPVILRCEICHAERPGYKERPYRMCGRCYRMNRRGSSNPNWRGGLTNKNSAFRKTLAYTAWRNAVFIRDKYTCMMCGQVGGDICADHIKPFALFDSLRLDVSNGRTLCKSCHTKTDTYLHRSRHKLADREE